MTGYGFRLNPVDPGLSFHFAYYSFVKIHGFLSMTQAIEAGIADQVWDLKELIGAP